MSSWVLLVRWPETLFRKDITINGTNCTVFILSHKPHSTRAMWLSVHFRRLWTKTVQDNVLGQGFFKSTLNFLEVSTFTANLYATIITSGSRDWVEETTKYEIYMRFIGYHIIFYLCSKGKRHIAPSPQDQTVIVNWWKNVSAPLPKYLYLEFKALLSRCFSLTTAICYRRPFLSHITSSFFKPCYKEKIFGANSHQIKVKTNAIFFWKW